MKKFIRLEEKVVRTMVVAVNLSDEQVAWIEKNKDQTENDLYVELAWKLADMDNAPAWDEDIGEMNNEELIESPIECYRPVARSVEQAMCLLRMEYEGGEDTWLNDPHEPKE